MVQYIADENVKTYHKSNSVKYRASVAHNADTGEADQTGYTVRAIYDGETLSERTFTDAQSHTAAAFYTSTLDYWRRQDDDRADGVSVQHIENATGDVLAETTFAMGREW